MATSTQSGINKKRCPYCGNNPVNHLSSYVAQSMTVAFTSPAIVRKLIALPKISYVERFMLKLMQRAFSLLGCITYHTDIDKALSDRSKVIWQEARALGIEMEQAYFLKEPTEIYRALLSGKWEYFISLPIPAHLETGTQFWLDFKHVLKESLEKNGFQVPKGACVSSLSEAYAVFDRVQKPVIVKPAVGSRGRHSLTFINTREELARAFRIAQKLCRYVIVEEHLTGSVYRVTYVGGDVAGVLEGVPPQVTGDGTSTIQELISQKDMARHARQSPVPVHDSSLDFLARHGYDLHTILENGKTIDLTEKIGLGYGGRSRELLKEAHPEFVAKMREVGNYLNTPLIGFDVISEDVTKHPDTVRWGIIEANSLPFIDLHHDPLEGEPENVARRVWGLWGVVPKT